MKISASCGNAPRSVSLTKEVYKLTLTAQTRDEKRQLADLLKTMTITGVAEAASEITIPHDQQLRDRWLQGRSLMIRKQEQLSEKDAMAKAVRQWNEQHSTAEAAGQ